MGSIARFANLRGTAMKKTGIAQKVLKTLLGLFLGLLAVEFSLYLYPPLLTLGYALGGRSPSCSVIQAFRGAQQSLRLHTLIERYQNSTALFTLMEEDAMGFHRWRTPEGDFWILGSSDKVLRVLVAQQETSIYSAGNSAIRKGDVVLDCGAHVGLFVRKALAQGAGKVIAIEPGPENLECLRRNLKEEVLRNAVTVYPKGVWDQETKLAFHMFPENSAADSFLPPTDMSKGEVRKLEVTTIDRLVVELGLARVDFIKLDIKGSTEKALLGAQQTLKVFKPRLAISTEEALDVPAQVIRLVRQIQPAYRTTCGYCAIEGGKIVPMVVFFE